MNREQKLYAAESEKTVAQFVQDFSSIAKASDFTINNLATMNMKETFTAHGGTVPEEFDLHMIQVCKPSKASISLAANPERAILMPKFVHVFSGNNRTQIRFLSHSPEEIRELVPNDAEFPDSLKQTFIKICAMIDQAR